MAWTSLGNKRVNIIIRREGQKPERHQGVVIHEENGMLVPRDVTGDACCLISDEGRGYLVKFLKGEEVQLNATATVQLC